MEGKTKSTILSGLAFGWHLGDAIIHRNTESRLHKTFMGIGLGWSGFWLAINLLAQAKTEYHETHYKPPMI